MNTDIIRKSVTFGIILIFLGVAIAPSINTGVVTASQDDDIVEVTTQVCGIQGYGDTTVKLTREQYQDLEQYLVELRARLNQTSTREEAIPIFKEAVVELNKYGLLPMGMDEKAAQRIVIGRTQSIVFEHLMKTILFRNQCNPLDNENILCLVYGSNISHWTRFFGFVILLLLRAVPGITYFALLNVRSIKFLSTIAFGEYQTGSHFYPASGWVRTIGLNGIKIFQNQTLYGALPVDPIHIFYAGDDHYCLPGIIGFTGFYIRESGVYLGSALWVKINSVHP